MRGIALFLVSTFCLLAADKVPFETLSVLIRENGDAVYFVGTEFVAQEAGKLLVLLEERMFPVRPENVMPVLDLIDHRGQFPAQSLIQPDAEDLADAVRRQPPKTDLARVRAVS
jgi:hypothetical protein